jgi:deoxyribonuclease-4
MSAIFGAAGNGDLFYSQGYKASEQMPQWLFDFGLDAYEYQCGNGVRIGETTANKIKKAAEGKIVMSLHSPYYINLATPDEEKRENSINYIMQSAAAAVWLGADRIVVHSGAIGKLSRQEALEYAKITLKKAKSELLLAGFDNIILCIETMGKINQLGDLDEVMELCRLDDSFLPTIDFGHLNARTLGGIKSSDDYGAILDCIENKLGYDRLKVFHSHFSKIEYTKGGEKKHLTFEDDIFGPDFEPLAELIAKKNLSPHIICESAGTQPEDALAMKKTYMSKL